MGEWPWLNEYETVPSLSGYRPVIGSHGMVCSPHNLASSIGIEILKDGGNAVDAAIATSAALMVVCPMQCGPGGDAFWLIFDPDKSISALDASGWSSRNASSTVLRQAGHNMVPIRGGFSITVPGALDGWVKAAERYGTRSLSSLLEPAAQLAEIGFFVSRHTRSSFLACESELRRKGALTLYCASDRVPAQYETLCQRQLAKTLRAIGKSAARNFYEGELANSIIGACQLHKGWLDENDLSLYSAEWVNPVSAPFRDLTVYTTPPSSQGFSLLWALKFIESRSRGPLKLFELATFELLVDAASRALKFRDCNNADRRRTRPDLSEFWSNQFSSEYPDSMRDADRTKVTKGDTAHLAVIDKNGLGVSLIQSLFFDFGSCIPVPDGGFTLQNRGAAFNLTDGDLAELGPRIHPPHTLMPTLVTRANKLVLLLGCMGGDGQMQTQLQLLVDIFDGQLDPQQAVSRSRWHLDRSPENEVVFVENDCRTSKLADYQNAELRLVFLNRFEELMGHAQVIQCASTGALIGATDPRSDGQVAAY